MLEKLGELYRKVISPTFLIVLILAVLIPAIFRVLGLYYVVYVITLIYFWAYVAQSWNILYGYAGQLSFGHAAFLGIGAYASSILFTKYGLSPWIGMWIGGACACLLAIIVGYPTLKLRGVYFALATIAIAEMVRLLTLKFDFITNGPLGIILPITRSPLYFQFEDVLHWCYTALGMLLILSYICQKIETSSLGIALRAIREDEEAASSIGIDTFKYKMIALLLSAFFTALGGAFFAQLTGYIRPDTVMTLERSEEIIIIGLVGGTGTFLGPIMGSMILITLRQTILAFLGGGYAGVHLIFYGLLIILVVRMMPEGVYPYIRRALEAVLKS
ncbi:MAG: branched-chain amino acid ABC transporter permease [Candidatus Methanomethylicota archaeon]|uniref:Branched-chain amino acid ABC transporter permease n=1 Tax=Thermoproteota archaeon TaxID=2056631 RepID=A0A497EVF5_9CREN|nr:MAG: branched-chain amino acid ABC transporter permease [Candidatus Verstraetearchaeota archaeon]